MLLIGPVLLLWMMHAFPGLGGFTVDVWVGIFFLRSRHALSERRLGLCWARGRGLRLSPKTPLTTPPSPQVPSRCSKEGYDAASDIFCPDNPDYEEATRRW
jgi:hypothetical protein